MPEAYFFPPLTIFLPCSAVMNASAFGPGNVKALAGKVGMKPPPSLAFHPEAKGIRQGKKEMWGNRDSKRGKGLLVPAVLKKKADVHSFSIAKEGAKQNKKNRLFSRRGIGR